MKHYNPSITERANRIFNLKNGDGLSEEIDGPVAVLPISPVCNIARVANNATNSAATIYTTPADKDFYLVAGSISWAKNAASDATNCVLRVTIDGVIRDLIRLEGITLTAHTLTAQQNWPVPLKIDRNTAIQIVGSSWAAGAEQKAGAIQGYTEEVTRT